MDEIGRFFESVLAGLGPELSRVKKLLEQLRECDGIGSSPWGERVQGGEHTPAAERRLEILERLKWFSPMDIEIVRLFESQREKKKAAYCLALLDGLSGDAVRSRGIGAGKQRELRAWLSREMMKIERRHGVK